MWFALFFLFMILLLKFCFFSCVCVFFCCYVNFHVFNFLFVKKKIVKLSFSLFKFISLLVFYIWHLISLCFCLMKLLLFTIKFLLCYYFNFLFSYWILISLIQNYFYWFSFELLFCFVNCSFLFFYFQIIFYFCITIFMISYFYLFLFKLSFVCSLC